MLAKVVVRSSVFVLLAHGLVGGCGGDPDPSTLSPEPATECSQLQGKSGYSALSGTFGVTVDGTRVDAWRPAIFVAKQHDGTYDLYVDACVLTGGVERWRLASLTRLAGPVRDTPVKPPVPSQQVPGFYGGVLDVVGNREHHFLLQGAGDITVSHFDPDARALTLSGEAYPVQGGTVGLDWRVTW